MLFRRFERLIDPFREGPAGMPPAGIIGFYLHYLRQVWPVMLGLLVIGFFVALIEVALFEFLGRLIDLAQTTPASEFFAEHRNALIWMAVVTLLLRPLAFALHDLLLHQALTPNLTSLIRWQNHRHLLRQSLAFFQNDFAGRIAQRVMQTGPSLRDSAVQVVDALWHVIVYAGSAMVLFAGADLRLMLPLMLWILGYLLALWLFVPRVRRRSAEASAGRSRVTGRVVDGYTNIMTLKLFAHTREEEGYARGAMQDLVERFRRQSRVISGMDISITCLNGLLIASTVGLALWLWSIGQISTGAIALATGLVIRIIGMSEWIMWVVSGIFDNVGTVQDGMRSIVQPLDVTDRPDARPLEVRHGEVRFEQVRFRYGGEAAQGQPAVIDGLELRVTPGEKIGLVGPSGAGKSTLVNLMLRLYDLSGGRILLDGQDVAGVTQESLRAQIGVVTQDTSLLHRSIRDNLRYGRPYASDATSSRPCASARRWLRRHPARRRRPHRAGRAGRRTRRETLRRPAPAHRHRPGAAEERADPDTRRSDLGAGFGDRGRHPGKPGNSDGRQDVIAIAHRLSTIARMDRLVVMDRGRIVETGTHAQLVALGGLYARLWQHQTGGFVGVD